VSFFIAGKKIGAETGVGMSISIGAEDNSSFKVSHYKFFFK
jgi:hypothetical protein